MRPHVSVYNCKDYNSPLHKHHLIPELREAPIDIDFLFRSCKYVHIAYELFVEKFELDVKASMPLYWWYDFFEDDDDTEADET